MLRVSLFHTKCLPRGKQKYLHTHFGELLACKLPIASGPDPDFRVSGGHNQARGQGGRLGPLWVQGKAQVGGSGGEAPDGKRFSVS